MLLHAHIPPSLNYNQWNIPLFVNKNKNILVVFLIVSNGFVCFFFLQPAVQLNYFLFMYFQQFHMQLFCINRFEMIKGLFFFLGSSSSISSDTWRDKPEKKQEMPVSPSATRHKARCALSGSVTHFFLSGKIQLSGSYYLYCYCCLYPHIQYT